MNSAQSQGNFSAFSSFPFPKKLPLPHLEAKTSEAAFLRPQHFRTLNKLKSTSMKKSILCHCEITYSLSRITEGKELNPLTVLLNAAHLCSPAFQLNW